MLRKLSKHPKKLHMTESDEQDQIYASLYNFLTIPAQII